MTTENNTPTAEIVEIVDTDEEKARREEEENQRRRNALRNEILGHLRLVSALLDELIVPDVPADEQCVITNMLRRHHLAAVDLLPEFRDAGGEKYQIDRGVLRHYFGDE